MMAGAKDVHGVMVPEQYDRVISSIVPSQPFLLSTMIDYVSPDFRNILELGCGTGILTGMIQERCPGADITALDISLDMLAVASAKPSLDGVRFLAQDLRDPWPQTRFDAIVTSLCLHHVSREDRVMVTQRAAQALTPEGCFICGDIFRAEHDWEEQVLAGVWSRHMNEGRLSGEVIRGMLMQRGNRLPGLTTPAWFRDILVSSGFERAFIPFTSGFVGLVVGWSPRDADGVVLQERPFKTAGMDVCRP